MKTIKKYFPLLLVALLSSVITLGGLRLMQKNNHTTSANSDDSNSYFSDAQFVGMSGIGDTDFRAAAEKSVNAVVSIKNYSTNTRSNNGFFDFFYGFENPSQNDSRPSGLGSGVIISKDGYIITNNHVIKNANKIEVTLNNQQTFTA